PPHFRPLHFAAAVAAGKHVFLEKPLAVDPVGARSVMVTAKKAKNLGLNVATGTQYRHQRDFVATYQQVMAGAIGEIEAAYAYYDTGQLWYRESRPDWSEMEYMIRDWVNWRWLSGDHIVEQFIHNLDTMYWFLGAHPVKAVGYGGRARRVTGDQFDFFSVEYVYDSGLHLSAMCRQINGTVHDVSNRLVGTNGITNVRNTIQRPDGKTVWQYQYPEEVKEVPWGAGTGQVAVSPYVQEHIDAVTNIRNNTPLVEAENTAISTMMAIMGREAAYTGQAVTWEDMMSSQLRLGPEEYAWGPVDIDKNVPVPGTA
ncbi:MAG TPA: Gfo/Idh/MocA family oxidoreductase, partial [Gammaproteobacteria bacterium]|nr:Gfo/Idh/MocA family oxidoreductase [Gammaproteobacteria bacterium]